MQRGAVDDDDAGRAVIVEIVGDLDDRGRRQRDLLARAVVAAGGDDAIADFQIGHTSTDALDHARNFSGRRERERRLDLVLALDHQDVEEVQRRRLDRDHRFAGTCHGIRHLSQHEIVGLAILRAENGFHGGTQAFRGGIIVGTFLPDLARPDNPDSLSAATHRLILVIASAAKQSRLFPRHGLWIASRRSQ